MPKNKGAGGKNRRRGTNKNEPVKRELLKKEEMQEYALVTKMLGNGRVLCSCLDGVQRLGTIRGGMRKKVWVNFGDIVLLGLRDYQEKKADVIGKYQPEEVRKLIELKEMPESFGQQQSRGPEGGADTGGDLIHFAEMQDSASEAGSDAENADDPRGNRNITYQAPLESDSEEEGDEEEESEEEVEQFSRSKSGASKRDIAMKKKAERQALSGKQGQRSAPQQSVSVAAQPKRQMPAAADSDSDVDLDSL